MRLSRLFSGVSRTSQTKAYPQPTSHELPSIGQALDASRLSRSFQHVFTGAPDIYNPTSNPSGRFGTTFVNRWRTKTEERGYYADQYVGHNPFAWDAAEQAVSIEMRPLTTTIKNAIQATGETVDTAATPMVTGLLNTAPSFSQKWGVFEIVAKNPPNPSSYGGVWFARWLTGSIWPPEIDLSETPIASPTADSRNAHSGDVDVAGGTYAVTNYIQHGPAVASGIDLSSRFVRHSVLWTNKGLVFYRDRVEVGRFLNLPANFNTPLWFIASLQAGQPAQDSWLGALNTSMNPVKAYLREFTAYSL